MIDPSRFVTLTHALARSPGGAGVLAQLHEYAVDSIGAKSSVLLYLNRRAGTLHANSSFRVEGLPPGPWFTGADAALADRALHADAPFAVADVGVSSAWLAHTGGRHAVLLPLHGTDGPLGVLVLGTDQASNGDLRERLAPVADAFVLALERSRLLHEAELQRSLRGLIHEFSQRVSSALALEAGLGTFCADAARLLGATRASVWLHDRQARELVLQASSDSGATAQPTRVSTLDWPHPAALGLRSDGGCICDRTGDSGASAVSTIAVGLKGRRRALGTLVFEGVRIEPGEDDLVLARAEEVARHLSAAVENTQLLDQVLRSHRELENTFNSLSELIVVCDNQLQVVHVNQAVAVRLAVPRHAVERRPLRDFVSPDLTAWLTELTGGPPETDAATRTITDPRLGGTFAVTVTPLTSDAGRIGLVVVARDITVQARLEAEQEQLRDRLVQSEKLAALGQFIAGIAHEMNNPLQGVLGHLELLRIQLPPKLRADARLIYREADRAAKIVRNLLIFAGPHRLSRKRLSVHRLISRVLTLRAPALRAAGIQIVRVTDESAPAIDVDPVLLQQALLNVILNAEQALAGRPDPRIEITTAYDAARGMVTIRVEDNGPGIAADALPRVFEPFFTTKDVGRGTGLGLAVSYGIIQEHGGAIRAASGGQGSAGGALFTIDLPVNALR